MRRHYQGISEIGHLISGDRNERRLDWIELIDKGNPQGQGSLKWYQASQSLTHVLLKLILIL